MTKTLKIVGLGGSVASNSKSLVALETALAGAQSAGATTQLLDIRQLALPMYNPDENEPTETAATLIEACHAADGLLWSSPMYQGTISGALKNAPYVVPVAAASRVFDRAGRIQDPAIEVQLKMLGSEVVRVAGRFAADDALHRQQECAQAAERAATAA